MVKVVIVSKGGSLKESSVKNFNEADKDLLRSINSSSEMLRISIKC